MYDQHSAKVNTRALGPFVEGKHVAKNLARQPPIQYAVFCQKSGQICLFRFGYLFTFIPPTLFLPYRAAPSRPSRLPLQEKYSAAAAMFFYYALFIPIRPYARDDTADGRQQRRVITLPYLSERGASITHFFTFLSHFPSERCR